MCIPLMREKDIKDLVSVKNAKKNSSKKGLQQNGMTNTKRHSRKELMRQWREFKRVQEDNGCPITIEYFFKWLKQNEELRICKFCDNLLFEDEPAFQEIRFNENETTEICFRCCESIIKVYPDLKKMYEEWQQKG